MIAKALHSETIADLSRRVSEAHKVLRQNVEQHRLTGCKNPGASLDCMVSGIDSCEAQHLETLRTLDFLTVDVLVQMENLDRALNTGNPDVYEAHIRLVLEELSCSVPDRQEEPQLYKDIEEPFDYEPEKPRLWVVPNPDNGDSE